MNVCGCAAHHHRLHPKMLDRVGSSRSESASEKNDDVNGSGGESEKSKSESGGESVSGRERESESEGERDHLEVHAARSSIRAGTSRRGPSLRAARREEPASTMPHARSNETALHGAIFSF